MTDITTRRAEALQEFIEVWGDGFLASDVGEKLTCREADAIVELLEAFGAPKSAAYWAEAHAFGDDEHDNHYEGSN